MRLKKVLRQPWNGLTLQLDAQLDAGLESDLDTDLAM